MKGMTIDLEGLLEMMRSTQGKRTQKKFAEDLGVSDTFLSDVLKGKRSPSDRILEQMGMERVVGYRRRSR